VAFRRFTTVAMLLALSASATAASAAETPVNGDTTTLTGTVTVLADSEVADAIITTRDGDVIPVDGDIAETLETGATVTATLDEAPTGTEAAEVQSVVVKAAAPAESDASFGLVRPLDIVVNTKTNDGVTQPTNDQIIAQVAVVSDYLTTNTDGAIGGLTVRSIHRYSSTLPCDSDAASDWDWADDAANHTGQALTSNDYIDAPAASAPQHLVLLGECRDDGKAAVGTVGGGLGWGGWVIFQDDNFSTSAGLETMAAVLAHELGHNIGLVHAGTPVTDGCDIANAAPFTDLGTCEFEEYGDWLSPMGAAWASGTSTPFSIPLLDSARRDWLGVMPDGSVESVSGAGSGTYTLGTLGTGTGLQALHITAPDSGRSFYVEYRAGSGEAQGRQFRVKDGAVVRVEEVLDDDMTSYLPTRKNLVTSDVDLGLQAGEGWSSAEGDVHIVVTANDSSDATLTVWTGEADVVEIGSLSLSGTPAVGTEVTASVTGVTPSSAILTYQWYRGTTAISGATAATYSPVAADSGKSLRAQVTATASGFFPALAVTSLAEGYVRGSLPAMVGTVAPGEILTAVPGVAVPSDAELAYQWLRGGSAISGATDATYMVSLDDVGYTLSVRVSAVWDGGSLVQTSAQSATVVQGSLEYQGGGGLYGSAVVGNTVTASVSPSDWAPTAEALSYQWYCWGDPIPGATAASYTIPKRAYACHLEVDVTATSTYLKKSVISGDLGLVTGGKYKITSPSLSGPAVVGTRLTVNCGVWVYQTTLTYQWLRNGKAISGATHSYYTPTAADRGTKLSVKVKGTHVTDTVVTATSNALTVGYGTLTATKPVISGTVKVGSTLTAMHGTWTSGTTLTYQWFANGVAIAGAKAKTYKVTSAVVGKKLTVRVVGTKSGYTSRSATSSAIAVLKVGAVRVSGTAKVGSTLTASVGTWTTGTAFTYQWYAGSSKIAGATGRKLVVTSALVGKALKVRVTGAKYGYGTVSVYSGVTAKVVK
jgi:hypothetical protein